MCHSGVLALEPLLAMSILKLCLGMDFLVVLQPGDVPKVPPAHLAQELLLLYEWTMCLCILISLFSTIQSSRPSSQQSDALPSCAD